MNLRQMQYFVAIAEDGSISRSAERLLVAQPSLSQQIKSLEAELGGALFERIPKGVRLTAAGKAFLPEARAAITHAANATRNARSVLGLEGGELEVATIGSIAYGILPSAFLAWHEHYPATTIALREYKDSNALAEAVRMGVGDIAVGPQPAQWRGPIIELGWEEFVLILPNTDPLAGTARAVPLSALADRDWVLFGTGHQLSDLILEACARAGFAPRRTVQTTQTAAASHLAAAGLGVTLIPDNVVPAGLLAATRHVQPPLIRKLFAYTRSEWPPLAATFVEALQCLRWPTKPRGATVIP
ncbi:DNA-binding transcriptional regulator, LysR family [Mycobacterium numidiamassiliense]|uniref:Probable hydrogen peroxide-inducible genes activator n=1 Tax=Mycobacterium numidiamassiliense TaxID=1841861 RepID=A0A2U3PDV0_9MYCO|nr:LysR family transcriptional regulator [Mycobacterium numidiamassiliense]SPM41946.1 DNA-binding transcriptional regulator, LysR family [Mycobacterium numidiamassiliense]